MHAIVLALALTCPHDPTLDAAARAARVPPAIVRAVARVESSCRPDAVSITGALGLMQVLPSWGRSNLTARCDPLAHILHAAPSLTTPAINACFGARILRYELARAHGSWRRALRGYSGNAYPAYEAHVRRALRSLQRAQHAPAHS